MNTGLLRTLTLLEGYNYCLTANLEAVNCGEVDFDTGVVKVKEEEEESEEEAEFGSCC